MSSPILFCVFQCSEERYRPRGGEEDCRSAPKESDITRAQVRNMQISYCYDVCYRYTASFSFSMLIMKKEKKKPAYYTTEKPAKYNVFRHTTGKFVTWHHMRVEQL